MIKSECVLYDNIVDVISEYVINGSKKELLNDEHYKEIIAGFSQELFKNKVIEVKKELKNIKEKDMGDFLKILIEKDIDIRKNYIAEKLNCYDKEYFDYYKLENKNYFLNMGSNNINKITLQEKFNFIKLLYDLMYEYKSKAVIMDCFRTVHRNRQKKYKKESEESKCEIYANNLYETIRIYEENNMLREIIFECANVYKNLSKEEIELFTQKFIGCLNDKAYIYIISGKTLTLNFFLWKKGTKKEIISKWFENNFTGLKPI